MTQTEPVAGANHFFLIGDVLFGRLGVKRVRGQAERAFGPMAGA